MSDDGWDPDKTPVRTPSGAQRLGLVPCPACRNDARVDCTFCTDEHGRPIRYVPVDAAIEWAKQHAGEDTTVVTLPSKP